MSEVKMEEGRCEDEEDIHPHCSTCIKISKCNIRQIPGNSCQIICCDAECGARFHACKYREHKLLCANEKVPCINAVNGCPIWLARRDCGRHLATCPASVVHCTMEWNRWPVCSRERQMHIPFHQPNPNARAGQLDVALALRDQRMLNEWLRAPRKTRRALRNSLTRRFPAVPLQLRSGTGCGGGGSNPAANGVEATGNYSSSENSSTYPSRTITDDEEDTPWEVRKAPPGLQRSVCGELYRASKQTTESLTAALNMITNGHQNTTSVPGENPEQRNILSWLDYVEEKENRNVLANGWSSENGYNTKNSFEEMDVVAPKVAGGDVCEMDQMISTSEELDSFESPGGYDILFVDHTVVSEISSASMTDHARKQPLVVNPPPPPTSPPLFVNLGLDLTLESITRYQTKPKSMYTFLCAQEFRRDEYSWHYKNIHSDIHGGLNGWLEQRCPLAHYGCMFSFRRFFPTCCGSTIVHNDILESFGVQPFLPNASTPSRASVDRNRQRTPPKWALDSCPMDVIPENKSDTNGEECYKHVFVLSQLPFEVLQHVARYLDSFSLCNLAMTSRLFRDVACSLLEERGIVVQQWEPIKCGKKSSWRIAYKRWFFSTAFTPIRQWGFEDKENMANHLKSCIYFQRCFKTDPYFYPVGINPNPVIYEKLKAGVEDALRAERVGIDTSTKL